MKAFWNGFEKRSAAWEAVKKPFQATGRFFKDVGEAASNINEATRGGRQAIETLPNIVERKTDKALKYLKRGGLGALGMYGAGKVIRGKADLERSKYYKNQNKLVKKQLKRLEETETSK